MRSRIKANPNPYEAFNIAKAYKAGDVIFISGHASLPVKSIPCFARWPRPVGEPVSVNAAFCAFNMHGDNFERSVDYIIITGGSRMLARDMIFREGQPGNR